MSSIRVNEYQYGSAAPILKPKRLREADAEYAHQAKVVIEEMVAEKTKAHVGKAVTFVQMGLVALSAVALIAAIAFYLVGVSNVKLARKSIEDTKHEIQVMQKENALLSLQIENDTDYEGIYSYATETLGMHLPEKQQVVTYNRAASEYVVKGMEIPHE